MVILVTPKLTPTVISHGIIMQGCMQYLLLKVSDMDTFGIINVYATQTSSKRAQMWKAIYESKLTASHWIMAANFNMTEDIHRANSVGHKFMRRREASISRGEFRFNT
jgi:hypothetical protein